VIKPKAQCVAVLTCLFLTSCAAKQPIAARPPVTVAKTYPKQIPKEGDFVIHGCAVTKETGNKADCICCHAVTQLVVNSPEKTTIHCR
jgi:hypothetical protein